MKVSIGAVIVAYNPELAEFNNVISTTLAQVDFLIIVNNGNDSLHSLTSYFPKELIARLNIIDNYDNLGVATALNIGINFLIEKKCSHLMFLDQDSLMPKDMVSNLYFAFSKLRLEGVKLAAIGPSFFDTSLQKLSPFIRFKRYGFKLDFGCEATPLVLVHLLITSGTLTSVEVLNDVGLMESGLFIDCVDHEWCLRAISKGYEIFGDNRIIMKHSIGDDPISLWGANYHKHSPLRHYYISRNSVHLFKRHYIPLNWRISLLLSAIKLFIFYSLINNNRLQNFQMMSKGFYHGILGKFGRYDLT